MGKNKAQRKAAYNKREEEKAKKVLRNVIIALVVIAVYTGIAQGIQPLLSRYYGVGEWRNIRKIWKYTMWTIIGLSLLIYIGMFVGAEQITAIFNSDGSVEMQKLAVQGIKIYFLSCVFAGYNIVLSIYFSFC